MRVFLDTNVLVSAFATRGLCADVLQLVLTRGHLVSGETVLAELQRVLEDKFGVPERTATQTVTFIREHAEVCNTPADLDLALHDSADARVLGEAFAAESDVFVTGDRELLQLENPPVRAVSPRRFWEDLRGDPTAS